MAPYADIVYLNTFITLHRTPLESDYPLVLKRLLDDEFPTQPNLFWTGYRRINSSHFQDENGLIVHFHKVEPVKVSFSTRNSTFILNHEGEVDFNFEL